FLGALVWFLTATSLNAQVARAPASNAELERRVQELEETIRQLKAERQKEAPAVTPAPLSSSTKPAPNAAGPSVDAPVGLAPSASAKEDSDNPEADGDQAPRWAGWDNGFFIQSPDKRFILRITGQIQADHRAFLDDVDFTDVDSFFVRRARFGLE